MTITNEDTEKRIGILEAQVRELQTRMVSGKPLTASPYVKQMAGTPTNPSEEDHPVSTIALPKVNSSEVTTPDTQRLEFIRKSELTDDRVRELNLDPMEAKKDEGPLSLGEPISGYDKMTSAEVIAKFRTEVKNANQRDQWLAYERANKNRDNVVTAYVNWNS